MKKFDTVQNNGQATKSVKGFTNPMFVSDEELKINNLTEHNVEYAKVEKFKTKDESSRNVGNHGIYEEIESKNIKLENEHYDNKGKDDFRFDNKKENESLKSKLSLDPDGNLNKDSRTSAENILMEENSLSWKNKALKRHPSFKRSDRRKS